MKLTMKLWVLFFGALMLTNGVYAEPPNTPGEAVMTEELMGRLIKYTRDGHATGGVDARICRVFDLCDGAKDMVLKLSQSDSTDGEHYFGLPPQSDSKDILIMVVRNDTGVEAFLTDKTGKLRAAAILKNGVARLITNEKAAAKFMSELALFAKEATEQLPPNKNNKP